MNERDRVVVTVDRLSKRYGDRSVLRGVSLRVHAGEVFGLLGPNGPGRPPRSRPSSDSAVPPTEPSGCSDETRPSTADT